MKWLDDFAEWLLLILQCGMSFDDLLRSLVMDDEEIITPPDKHIMFTHVNVDETEQKGDSRTLPGGRALLTKTRLLCCHLDTSKPLGLKRVQVCFTMSPLHLVTRPSTCLFHCVVSEVYK
jgi:hypothetical protein